jgi:FMN-binding domain.
MARVLPGQLNVAMNDSMSSVKPRFAIKRLKQCLYGTALALILAAASVPVMAASEKLAAPDTSQPAKSRSSFEEFLGHHLGEESHKPSILWINGELREQAETILGHSFSSLRVRYWGKGDRTLWVLDEIGKEMPITIGLVVDSGKISEVRILEYRETRGGEVQYPFFTSQFRGLTLDDSGNRLNSHIDGITGATLSVAAVRKIAILALVFHEHTPYSDLALDQ